MHSMARQFAALPCAVSRVWRRCQEMGQDTKLSKRAVVQQQPGSRAIVWAFLQEGGGKMRRSIMVSGSPTFWQFCLDCCSHTTLISQPSISVNADLNLILARQEWENMERKFSTDDSVWLSAFKSHIIYLHMKQQCRWVIILNKKYASSVIYMVPLCSDLFLSDMKQATHVKWDAECVM